MYPVAFDMLFMTMIISAVTVILPIMMMHKFPGRDCELACTKLITSVLEVSPLLTVRLEPGKD